MAPTLLRGLTILGPGDRPGPDLALELGLSAWMFRNQTDLYGVHSMLPALRAAVLEAAEIDPAHEPVPFVGRSLRDDVLSSVAYLGELLERAAAGTGCSADELAERAIARIGELRPASTGREDDEALGQIIPLR